MKISNSRTKTVGWICNWIGVILRENPFQYISFIWLSFAGYSPHSHVTAPSFSTLWIIQNHRSKQNDKTRGKTLASGRCMAGSGWRLEALLFKHADINMHSWILKHMYTSPRDRKSYHLILAPHFSTPVYSLFSPSDHG